MRTVKHVSYANGRPIITIRVPSFRRILNAPRAQVRKENVQPLVLGF